MMTFDSPRRETCSVREARTNTPLQALNLMNDVTFLEAARKLGERMMNDGGVARGFSLATGRIPSAEEALLLRDTYERFLKAYEADPAAARSYLSQGESARDERLHAAALAAYTGVASILLNLDEVVTRE